MVRSISLDKILLKFFNISQMVSLGISFFPECRSLSFDAMTAHTAVVFTRYMMLSIENRESNDNRSLGELFLYFTDEMSDITWIEAFQMLLQMFRKLLEEHCDLVDEKIDELVEAFISTLPSLLQSQLVAA